MTVLNLLVAFVELNEALCVDEDTPIRTKIFGHYALEVVQMSPLLSVSIAAE